MFRRRVFIVLQLISYVSYVPEFESVIADVL